MNLFILDNDINLCAQMACDKHVVKMPLETAQMLCTAHHLYNPDNPMLPLLYKETHKNHPCTKWVCESATNYLWTYMFWLAQCEEYSHRFHKHHLTHQKYAKILAEIPPNIPAGKQTPFAQAMPDEYKNDDAVTAYRDYYTNEKAHILQYNNGRSPAGWVARAIM